MTAKHIRGRFLFREVNERGYDLPLGSVTKDGGVEYRSDLDIAVWNPGDDVSGYKRVRPDDFVIGLRSFQSGIGHSSIEALVSPAYTVLRPVSELVHPPFFRHLFKSSLYVSRLENVAQGIRQGRTIAAEDFYNIECPVPPLQEQRAIADYLDNETTRIDALIAKKQRMIELFRERCRGIIDNAIGPFKRTVQLRRLVCDLTSGPRGWAELVGETGAPFLRITNISRSSIDLDMHDVLCVNPPSTPESRRARTKAGDVLVSITADIGSVGVVSNELAGSFFSQHLARVTPIACDSTWLAYAIKSTEVRAQLDAGQYGGTKTQLALGDVAGLRVPDVGLAEQRATAVRIQAAISRLQSAEQTLVSQIGLLREHRQALITAAVTGELEIPGVAA